MLFAQLYWLVELYSALREAKVSKMFSDKMQAIPIGLWIWLKLGGMQHLLCGAKMIKRQTSICQNI